MITLYWCPQTRAARILWLLEEMDQPFEVRMVDIRDPESKNNPDFIAASPMGKVPAILDSAPGGAVHMADSAAIALYLADRYPSSGLAPAIDQPSRGQYLYWMIYSPGVIEPAMMERFMGMEVSRATSGWGNFDTMIEVLEDRLNTRDWLMGEQFSAADVLAGSSVYFMNRFGILPDSPILSGYLERCLARPAYAKALARDAEA
ncbi:MAG: glutathione S-transferase family protein [Gammaproteobacteria bacterium]|nr:glutathione S-transferase family protein [Gammaproteobacteria bacterium]